jgi:predicted RND superfamily exporter protein
LDVDRHFRGAGASIITAMFTLMVVAARTSETSVDIQLRTWQYIPQDSELLADRFMRRNFLKYW